MKFRYGLLALVAWFVPGIEVRADPPAEASGKVVTWGENHFGQLGMGTVTRPDPNGMSPFNPATVPSLARISGLAAGMGTAAAIDAEGAVWLWGATIHAPVRDGEPLYGTPVKLPGLSGVVEVSLGNTLEVERKLIEHGLALKDDGTVWAWGSNACGELGREPDVGRPFATSAPRPSRSPA